MDTTARAPRRGRALAVLGDHLLSVLAIAGTLCILLVLLGWAFNISIMMFRTGSMSPTITAGSIAFVREIPATEIAEGDVVTVDRGVGVLPVTHRVVEITDTDEATGAVTFEMRGDANDVDDPEPYTATDVRRVIFSIPAVARGIQWFSSPLVLGGLTLGASALVIWAFWPRDAADDEGADDDGPDEGESANDPFGEERTGADPSSRRSSSAFRVLTLPLAAAAVIMVPAAGHAETTLITGEHLRLQTVGEPAQMENLAPGRPVIWDVGVWADAPEPGEIHVGITGRGELAQLDDALKVSVQGCSVSWSEGRCPAGATELLVAESLDRIADVGPTLHLTTMPSDEVRWLRIEVLLDEGRASAAAGTEGDVLIHAVGAGEEISSGEEPPTGSEDASGPDDGLARTGAAGALALLAVGLLSVALGLVLGRRGTAGARR